MNAEPGQPFDQRWVEVSNLWIVSRICEEFHCLPDEARRAMDDDYNGSIFKIIDMRGFANAKQRIDQADSKNVPTDKQAVKYLQIEMGLVGKELGVKTDED